MSVCYVSIGSVQQGHLYDDTEFPYAIDTDGVINGTILATQIIYTVVDLVTSTVITDLNTIYTVTSGSPVVVTLPAVTEDHVGSFIEIYKMGVGNLTITAGAGNFIAAGAATTSITNIHTEEAKAAGVVLRCVSAGQWVVSSLIGTWQ